MKSILTSPIIALKIILDYDGALNTLDLKEKYQAELKLCRHAMIISPMVDWMISPHMLLSYSSTLVQVPVMVDCTLRLLIQISFV